MKNEYLKFTEANDAEVPREMGDKVLSRIIGDIKVNPLMISFKLLVLHVASAVFILQLCPQFNVGGSYSSQVIEKILMQLMQINHLLCAAFCGVLFLGTSAVLSATVLNQKELFWLKQKAWWTATVITLVSFFYFMYAGDAMQSHYDIWFSLVWIVSACVASVFIYRAGFQLKCAR